MLVYKYRSGTTRDIEEGKIKIDNQEVELFDLLIKNPISNFVSSMNHILKDYIQQCRNYGIYSLSKNYLD